MVDKTLMSDAFSSEQLAQLRAVFREELADAGLRIDGADHVDEARRDFMFLPEVARARAADRQHLDASAPGRSCR
ncbi:MAG: hypothetical protein J0I48_13195 [Devosia sp.]|uniref:hypothetical protein n=1 Tax=Devosia sp. 66-22 TaxID=1895753 RepID=UPI001AD3F1D3|nr:hypothetical protein [Devosia sp. 66-22]MBN9347134.1 hypothetical protein [Devosia sp.]